MREAHIDLGQQILGHAVAGSSVNLVQSSGYVGLVDEDAEADPVRADDLQRLSRGQHKGQVWTLILHE